MSGDSMKDKVVLITGANSGIGFEAAVELARRGATVVMAGRDPERGEQARQRAIEKSGAAGLEWLTLDLADLACVRRAADEFLGRHDKLHVLLNNAGVWTKSRATTVDGFESTFGTNHLGHFLLTKLLLPALQADAPSRIVNVSSEAHKSGRLDFDDLQMERGYSGWRAYANSKLANVLFTRELARRLPKGVTATAVHPGVINTRIFRDLPGWLKPILALFFATPEKGAEPLVRLAADGQMSGVTGRYFCKLKEKPGAPASRDEAAAARLWDVSERLTAQGR